MKTIINQVGKMKLLGFIPIVTGIGIITGVITLLFAFTPMTQGKQESKWAASPDADKKTNPVASDEKSIAAGKILYTNNCKSCHGTKGKGDGPKSSELDKVPGDFTKEDFQKQSDGALFWKITEGKKPMPSFKKELTDEQRWQAINYIRTLATGESKKK
jgi:mono/diheme cytochrome c family protein